MPDTYSESQSVGGEVASDVKRSAERLRDDVQNAAGDVTERVREEATNQANRARTGAASEMSSIAKALSTAAGELPSGSVPERAFAQIAESLTGASDTLRDGDLGVLAGKVSTFARRNPMGFLGGAVLAGFAATRFAQASSSRPRDAGPNVMSPAANDRADPARAATPVRSETADSSTTSAGPAATPAHLKTPGGQS